MATITGTSSTYGDNATTGGNREDLEDVIWDLFPEDTWALSNLDKVKATATFHEWLTDDPAAAAANRQLEGDDTTFASIVQPNRYGNYCQISNKSFIISGTQEVVSKAGRKSEIGRQAMKKMRELKRDVEFALTRNQAGTAGGATTARSSAGMESWINATTASSANATNVVLSTTTASATTAPLTGGTPAAPTDSGTLAALTEADLKLALQGAWDDGGDTDTILVSPTQKAVIDGFTGIATRNVDIGRTSQGVITAASNVYVSSFGVHRVVQHRYMRTNVVLCLDSSMWAYATLRPFQSIKLAKTGDAEKRLIQTEYCLVCRHPAANAKVVALS